MLNPAIFKANDIRGLTHGADVQLDADGARVLGRAWVEVLSRALPAQPERLVVGRDMRLTSPELAAAFTDGVLGCGVDVVDIGLASTDLLWFASGQLGLPGVMITASHNPGEWNGVKFCLAHAAPVASDHLTALRERAIALLAGEASALDVRRGTATTVDLLPAYVAHLLSLVDLSSARRLRIVADAGNGMAGHTLPAVFARLDADLIGLHLDLDGTFPHHPPNPLEPENLRDAQRAVIEHGADLGLVFDGDADRCFLIDERGAVVDPSAVTAAIAIRALAREPGARVVVNTITSAAVGEIVAEHGGQIVVSRVGHTAVKATMAEHDAVFGGEHSAHYYFRDFWRADTGMLAALHVMALLGPQTGPLSAVMADFSRYVRSGEINSTVPDAAACQAAVAHEWAGHAQDHHDGLTVSGPDWWFNLRASNTEPLLRLNVEAATDAEVARLTQAVLARVGTVAGSEQPIHPRSANETPPPLGLAHPPGSTERTP